MMIIVGVVVSHHGYGSEIGEEALRSDTITESKIPKQRENLFHFEELDTDFLLNYISMNKILQKCVNIS